jgi:hypothetical protein
VATATESKCSLPAPSRRGVSTLLKENLIADLNPNKPGPVKAPESATRW